MVVSLRKVAMQLDQQLEAQAGRMDFSWSPASSGAVVLDVQTSTLTAVQIG
jgi:hypothetical protein